MFVCALSVFCYFKYFKYFFKRSDKIILIDPRIRYNGQYGFTFGSSKSNDYHNFVSVFLNKKGLNVFYLLNAQLKYQNKFFRFYLYHFFYTHVIDYSISTCFD